MIEHFRKRRAQWLPILNTLGAIGEELYALSTKVTGKAADPQQISARLFRRLFSNANAFNVLIQHGHELEAQMVLRHAVEAAICLAMLSTDEEEFAQHLLSDTAWTVIGQLPYWYPDEAEQAVQKQAILDQFGLKNAAGKSHRGLQWNDLAKAGGVPHLYGFYKNLSGTAAHVSGLSSMLGMANTGHDRLEANSQLVEDAQAETALSTMAGTVHSACLSYAFILKNPSFAAPLSQVMKSMAEVYSEPSDAMGA
jgi:hypothetical protein